MGVVIGWVAWLLLFWVAFVVFFAALWVGWVELGKAAERARFRRWLREHEGVPRDWWDEIHGGGRG